jgi:hypothetical protein
MQYRKWTVHLPSDKYARMLGGDRVDFTCVLKLVFPKAMRPGEEEARGQWCLLPNSDDEEVPIPPDPPIWKAMQNAFHVEQMKSNGCCSIDDYYIPISESYVFIKERLDDADLQARLDAYDFKSLASAAHTQWRLFLLEQMRENKKRKRELNEALDHVTFEPIRVKRARGDVNPEGPRIILE